MAETKKLDEFVTALRSMIENRESGAFFITTPERHSAILTVKEGSISGLKYRQKKDYEAASALADKEGLNFRKASTPTELPGSSAVDTRSVLAVFSGKNSESTLETAQESAPGGTVSKTQRIARDVGGAQPEEPNPPEEAAHQEKTPDRAKAEPPRNIAEPPAARERPGLAPAAGPQPGREPGREQDVDLEAVRARFISAVGPIGSMLFDEVVEHMGKKKARSPEGVSVLVSELASEISDKMESKRFQEDILGE